MHRCVKAKHIAIKTHTYKENKYCKHTFINRYINILNKYMYQSVISIYTQVSTCNVPAMYMYGQCTYGTYKMQQIHNKNIMQKCNI